VDVLDERAYPAVSRAVDSPSEYNPLERLKAAGIQVTDMRKDKSVTIDWTDWEEPSNIEPVVATAERKIDPPREFDLPTPRPPQSTLSRLVGGENPGRAKNEGGALPPDAPRGAYVNKAGDVIIPADVVKAEIKRTAATDLESRRGFFSKLFKPAEEAVKRVAMPESAHAASAATELGDKAGGPLGEMTRRKFIQTAATAPTAVKAVLAMELPAAIAAVAPPMAPIAPIITGVVKWTNAQEARAVAKLVARLTKAIKSAETAVATAATTGATTVGTVVPLEAAKASLVKANATLAKAVGWKELTAASAAANPLGSSTTTASTRVREGWRRGLSRSLYAEGHDKVRPATTGYIFKNEETGKYLGAHSSWVSDPGKARTFGATETTAKAEKLLAEGVSAKVETAYYPNPRWSNAYTKTSTDSRIREISLPAYTMDSARAGDMEGLIRATAKEYTKATGDALTNVVAKVEKLKGSKGVAFMTPRVTITGRGPGGEKVIITTGRSAEDSIRGNTTTFDYAARKFVPIEVESSTTIRSGNAALPPTKGTKRRVKDPITMYSVSESIDPNAPINKGDFNELDVHTSVLMSESRGQRYVHKYHVKDAAPGETLIIREEVTRETHKHYHDSTKEYTTDVRNAVVSVEDAKKIIAAVESGPLQGITDEVGGVSATLMDAANTARKAVNSIISDINAAVRNVGVDEGLRKVKGGISYDTLLEVLPGLRHREMLHLKRAGYKLVRRKTWGRWSTHVLDQSILEPVSTKDQLDLGNKPTLHKSAATELAGKRAYHGAPVEIVGNIYPGGTSSFLPGAVHFAEDAVPASAWAGNKPGANVTPVLISGVDVLDLTGGGTKVPKKYADAIRAEFERIIKNPHSKVGIERQREVRGLLDKLESGDFDGYELRNEIMDQHDLPILGTDLIKKIRVGAVRYIGPGFDHQSPAYAVMPGTKLKTPWGAPLNVVTKKGKGK
jgi:hypothetical protein